jgi:cob(I)alamin adenosyltransferase
MMKIYTKGGDKGETGLFGGKRVPKSSARIEAYGTIDELNSFIGLAITEVKSEDVKKLLQKIQDQLFTVGADLAAPETEIDKKHSIVRVPESFFLDTEKEIDKYDAQLKPLQNFILPGGSKPAALLNICRVVCRRAERRVVALSEKSEVGGNIIIFLNRLSDLFFVLARYENMISGIPDVIWKK